MGVLRPGRAPGSAKPRPGSRAPPSAGYEGRFDAAGWQLIGAVMRLRTTLPHRPPRLLDLGAGRGRDAIYFGRRGFRVVGLDLNDARLDRGRRRAARYGIPVRFLKMDFRTCRIRGPYEVVFSSSALHHLAPRLRAGRLAFFQSLTAPGGLHAVNALVSASSGSLGPDVEAGVRPFRPGELVRYYSGWAVLETRRLRLACRFGGRPHHHTWEHVIARRPG